jgi:hypothetical protein
MLVMMIDEIRWTVKHAFPGVPWTRACPPPQPAAITDGAVA